MNLRTVFNAPHFFFLLKHQPIMCRINKCRPLCVIWLILKFLFIMKVIVVNWTEIVENLLCPRKKPSRPERKKNSINTWNEMKWKMQLNWPATSKWIDTFFFCVVHMWFDARVCYVSFSIFRYFTQNYDAYKILSFSGWYLSHAV